MSLARAVARNTGIQIFGRVISIALALVVIAIMTRALGPEGFGGYSTIIAFLQFFGITVDFGLTLTANRMLSASSRQSGEKILGNLMTMRLISAVIFLGIAPAIALFFPYPLVVKQGILITTLSLLAVIMGQTLTPVFQKELRMGYVVFAELVGRFILLAGAAAAAYFNAGLLAFMVAAVAGSVVQYLFLHIYVRQFLRFRWSFDKAIWIEIFKTSWPIGISIIFNLIYLKADTIILSVLRSQSEVGFYGAAYRVIDQFTALATMFIALVLPPMTAAWVANNRERFRKIYQGAFDAYAAIAFPLLVGAWLLGPKLMTFVAGSEFAVSGSILGILMVAMVGVFFSTLFGHTVVAIGKQKAMIWGYACTAVVGLLAYFLIIPQYGMVGAAWATVGTEMLITLLTYLMVWRTTSIAPRLSLLIKSISASILMGLFLIVLRETNLLLLILGGMLIYLAALYTLGGVKKETLREILSLKSS